MFVFVEGTLFMVVLEGNNLENPVKAFADNVRPCCLQLGWFIPDHGHILPRNTLRY